MFNILGHMMEREFFMGNGKQFIRGGPTKIFFFFLGFTL